MLLSTRLVALIATSSPVLADFLGPSYPPPVDLTSDSSLVAAAWRDVRSNLSLVLAGNDTVLPGHVKAADAENVTFSLGAFSLYDPGAASSLQFHYTSPEIANAPNGTHAVDGDSIYRIASVTKVFTVLTGLLNLKPADWERPLSEVLAPLAGDGAPTPWDKVTLRVLAAQIAGVPRDGFPSAGEIALQALQAGLSEAKLTAASGLPPYNASDPLSNPPCVKYVVAGQGCPPDAYLLGVANRPPAFLPWTTPGYSNNGFTLLGLAIANITGKSMEQLYNDGIFNKLGMTSSSAAAPSKWHKSVIAGDPAAGFAVENGIFVSSGGLFSTTRDLARFGVSILNSTLLDDDQTRRWLKPVSHTARLRSSVGSPWEILRFTHASGTVTDIYTKSGDSGYYSAYLVLLPDYGAGFTILSASTITPRFQVVGAIAELIADKLVPALAAQAAAEAARNFAGVYNATHLNSSLTLSLDPSVTGPPGLVISSWISNGTNVLPWLTKLTGSGPFRLVPSVVQNKWKTKEVTFRMVNSVDAPSPDESRGLFTGFASEDWLSVDQLTYYGAGLSLFVAEVGCSGKAKSITPAAYRDKLIRPV